MQKIKMFRYCHAGGKRERRGRKTPLPLSGNVSQSALMGMSFLR
jgi:hypothetical protein